MSDKKAKRKGGKLFSKPFGESEYRWNTSGMLTTGALTREACGTNHPERDHDDESYIIIHFLGLRVIQQCCGKVLDVVYDTLLPEIIRRLLKEFAENPLDSQYEDFRSELRAALAKAKRNAKGLAGEAGELKAHPVLQK